MTQYTLCHDLPITEQQDHMMSGERRGVRRLLQWRIFAVTCWTPSCCVPPTRVCGAGVPPAARTRTGPGSWRAAWTTGSSYSSCRRWVRCRGSAPWSCDRPRRSPDLQHPRRPDRSRQVQKKHCEHTAENSVYDLTESFQDDKVRVSVPNIVSWKIPLKYSV